MTLFSYSSLVKVLKQKKDFSNFFSAFNFYNKKKLRLKEEWIVYEKQFSLGVVVYGWTSQTIQTIQ